jgi:hypothetical protein
MITTERLIDILNRAWNFRHNSLAAYILSAEPYVAGNHARLLERVQGVAIEDARLEGALLEALSELEASPRGVPYEPFVSELNYLGIDYLTRVLREKLQAELTRLQAERQLAAGNKTGEEVLDTVLAATQVQIDNLS